MNMTKSKIKGDNRLNYITKVHLERIPLRDLLNYQQKSSSLQNRTTHCDSFLSDTDIEATTVKKKKSKAIPENICHNTKNIKDDKKIIEKKNLNLKKTRISNRLLEKNNKCKSDKSQDYITLRKNTNKEKPIKSIKSNGPVDKEKQFQNVTKIDKSPKKMVSSNKNNNHRKDIQSTTLITTNNNLVGNNCNSTLKTPIYKQFQVDMDDKYHKDEYDFIVSPSNTRHKFKKKRKNNKVQTPVSFHLFSIPKFTKRKPRRRRQLPRTFKAFLTINPEKLDKSKTFMTNYSASTVIYKNKEPILQKPSSNLDKVITDIKSKIRKKEEEMNSKKQEISQDIDIQHDNEDYDSEGIRDKEDDENIVVPINVDNESQKSDKSVEEEIDTCFGFDDNDRSPEKKSNITFNKTATVKSLSSSNRASNNKINILSNILIEPSLVTFAHDKTINQSSRSLFEISNSALNDTKNSQNKVDSLQSTINDSLNYDHLRKNGPGANSTMIRPVKEKSYSWRVDDHLFQYNPHFLMLKDSSLPVLDQDSIIDHTFDDSISQNTKKSVQNNKDDKDSEKPFVQKSILDFIESSGIRDIEPGVKRVSLFNIDELSPLKESQQQNLPERNSGNVKRSIFNRNSPKKNSPSNKENVNVNNMIRSKRRKENSPTKHVSFGSLDKENNPKGDSFSKNETSKSSVTENLLPVVILKKLDLTLLREKKLNLSDDFGFNSLLIDDKNVKDLDKKQVPTRISLREIKRVLIRNNSDNEGIKVVPEHSPNKIVNDSDSDNDAPNVDSPQHADEFPNDKINVGLFEDPKLDPKSTAKKYERKRPVKRKRRVYSKDSDTEHSVVAVPKKRKKDIMSKEEAKEFEKWAAAFNSECEEVDKFDLEIV